MRAAGRPSCEASLIQDYFQQAYVTNDLDCAIEEIREIHGMGPFKVMRDLRLPLLPSGEAVGHFALAFKGALEFEVIEPLEGDVEFYGEILPAHGYATRYHHLGRFFASAGAYHVAVAQARARWSIPITGAVFDGLFSYANARADLGHHLEFFTFPDDAHLDGVPRY
jgi:hypothetical protein